MTYQPHLIANFATGINDRLQPWLSQDDAQEELFDGYVYRGVMSKREGYNYLADGLRGGSTYRESRIVHGLTAVAVTTGVINSSNKTFTFAANTQIARGSFVVTGTTPAQSLTDNGVGGFSGNGTGTINYLTGAVSITFTLAPTAPTVTAAYSYMPDNPVMMVATYVTNTNGKELIVADTQYVNRMNLVTNVLQDITPVGAGYPFTGTKYDFFTWVNYATAANESRLLFCNNKDIMQAYDGTTVAAYVYNADALVAPIIPSKMVQMKDRLVLLRTTEGAGSVIHPQRIRISGTGANSDDFRTSATGAGFIDIPDGSWIQGADFNRDDLIIFTESSSWRLSYTGNDTVPFVLDKIDESRGSQAPFGVITYLNRTSALSPRGLIMSDGYRVERQDENIPDFSFNQIDQNDFRLCFAGSVDADRDHYLIYPPPGRTTSQRILTTNYDEDNYAIYRLPLSCMGKYIQAFNTTWDDLLQYDDWDAMSNVYGNWNSFAFSKGAPFSVGGGHHGEIWQLTVAEQEDNPVHIRNITKISSNILEITTDWNNYSLNDPTSGEDSDMGADFIAFSGVQGMAEINQKQYPIESVTSNNVFRVKTPETTAPFGAYVPNTGIAVRVIPFSALTKKFNPYVSMDKKVRCGWLYMYVDSTETDLNRNIAMVNASQSDPCVITTNVDHNLKNGNTVAFFGVGGMTQLNSVQTLVTVLSATTFSLDGIDSTAYTLYTSGGYVTTPELAKMTIEVIVSDNDTRNQTNYRLQSPYRGTCSNLYFETGVKKWYKIYINQVGRFIQFRIKNTQAGSTIKVQALMPGFQPIGRLL